jgi:hypothetical protein
MQKFVELLQDGTIAQLFLVMTVTGTVCYQVVVERAVPDVLGVGFGAIVGYFFATTVKNSTTKKIEDYVRSLGLGALAEDVGSVRDG